MTSTLAIAPSLAPVQTPLLAPVHPCLPARHTSARQGGHHQTVTPSARPIRVPTCSPMHAPQELSPPIRRFAAGVGVRTSAAYEDVNDAERLCRDPAMGWVVGDRAITGSATSASPMGRFERKWINRPENLSALADLPGRWIGKVHQRQPPGPSCSTWIRAKPDLRRAGRQRLQRPFRLHLQS